MAPYIRNVVKLAGGSVFGQMVVIVALPIMAKFYTPDQFGVAQAALSALTILLIVGALRLEIAILSVPEEDLHDLFRCAWWLCVLTATIAMLIAISLAFIQTDWKGELRMAAILLPLSGLFACWNQLMVYLGLRNHAFGASARAKVVQPLGYSVSALGIGAIRGSAAGLLLADAVGRAAACAYMARAVGLKIVQLKPPSWRLLRNTLSRHRELAGIGLFSSLINAAGSAFTAAMLLWLFGAFEAGQYAMAERMVGMPVGLLSAAISQVFIANLSRSVLRGDLCTARNEYLRVLRVQTLTGVPIALLIFFMAPMVLDLLLGDEWETAGEYVKALTLLYLCSYIAGPLNMTLTVLGCQRLQLIWDCMRFTIVAAAWGAIWLIDLEPKIALMAYSISAFVAYGIYLVLAYWAMRRPILITGVPT
jgi:O-antigen/teichoic acid export membrane protein